ncbi:MFS transporter [Bradyrhizobium sp. Arg237L]|uniref:MFS transporter n=1 Tax=Bradyrhizobium sp. Arg237L TaxID=3003352 RepID=UPI00249DF9C6|nr:MFS transporter [Bradyrhizobium sp. Arg237L]MDI4234133.1 MFS transporter [Bradyrhizobium sp. Arg237L]
MATDTAATDVLREHERERASVVPLVTTFQRVRIVMGVALGLGAGFAPVYVGTIALFLKPISETFGWARAQTSAASVLSMLGLAFGSMIIGRLVDRIGSLRVIAASALLMACLIALLSRSANAPWTFSALSFAIGMAGAGTTPPGYFAVLARRFDGRLGLALGIAGVGMGLGTVSMPLVAGALIAAQGWRTAYVSLALLSVTLTVIACGLIFYGDSKAVEHSRSGSATSAQLEGHTLRAAFGESAIWLLFAVVLLVAMASIGVSIHLVSLLTDRGIGAGDAARVVAVSGLGIILGRLGMGYLLDHFQARRVAAAAFLMGALGPLLLLVGTGASELGAAYAAGVLTGLVLGAEGDFLPFLVRRYFGLRAFGTIYGLLFFAHGIGGVIGPILYGRCFDSLGVYTSALWGSVIALGLAAVLILLLGRYRYPK